MLFFKGGVGNFDLNFFCLFFPKIRCSCAHFKGNFLNFKKWTSQNCEWCKVVRSHNKQWFVQDRGVYFFRAHYSHLSIVVVFVANLWCNSKGYREKETSITLLKREGSTFSGLAMLALNSCGFCWQFWVHQWRVWRKGNFFCFARERGGNFFRAHYACCLPLKSCCSFCWQTRGKNGMKICTLLQFAPTAKQALRNSCELLRQRKELHASSCNCMQGHSIQAYVAAGKLM